jgi:hypothetical protein
MSGQAPGQAPLSRSNGIPRAWSHASSSEKPPHEASASSTTTWLSSRHFANWQPARVSSASAKAARDTRLPIVKRAKLRSPMLPRSCHAAPPR